MHRSYHLDLLRTLSVFLVIFGHFIMVGNFAKEIPGIVSDPKLLPLLNSENLKLWLFEVKLIEYLRTQTAVLGVAIFFVVTGYLIAGMMDRYSRAGFLINRFFRIFPALVACVILVGFYIGEIQGIKFSPSSYLASITLVYEYVPVAPVMGILWTLVIEVIFYMTAAFIGRFNIYKIFLFQGIILGVVALGFFHPIPHPLGLLGSSFRYMAIISIGVAIFLAEKEEVVWNKIILLVGSYIFACGTMYLYSIFRNEVSTYRNPSTIAVAAGVFILAQALSKFDYFNAISKRTAPMANIVYPVYLLHTALGLGTMALLKGVIASQALLLTIALAVTLAAAYAVHIVVERPGIRLGRKLTLRLKPSVAAPAAAAASQ